ncbi:MAG TPA: cyclic nucleotide-binding domain-containing protein [bacterium]|nr:cyclic nucleotide-binding domain-containing protein [bacterium]
MAVDLNVFKDALPYRGFRDEDWKALAEVLTEVRSASGSRVFRENDPGDGFFWIRSGKVKISRQVLPEGKKTPQEQLLTVLTAGQVFGEMALVDKAPRSADATAESDTVLFHLSEAAYEGLQKAHPGTALRIQDVIVMTLCSRIREANRSFELIRFWCT